MRILVVEDDPQLNASLKELLEGHGYACDVALTGDEGRYCALEYALDLAIVDIGLPGCSGLEIIEAVRAAGSTLPVLLLTARDSWQDKVAGLEAGADDYLTKPFHQQELLARVNALLRRSAGKASAVLDFAPLALDTNAKSLAIDGQPVKLTAYEYRVLECLMFRAGEVLSKAYLSEHIYDEAFDNDSNVMEVFVGRLRKKLRAHVDGELIETVRGQGYRFVAPGEGA